MMTGIRVMGIRVMGIRARGIHVMGIRLQRLVQRGLVRCSIGLLLTAMLAVSLPAGLRAADGPTYMVLRTPRAKTSPHATYGHHTGKPQEVTANGYAYGWFGAAPRNHWSRSFGTSRNYTQWTRR